MAVISRSKVRGGSTQLRLDFGEDLLDGDEVGGIGRQQEQAAARAFNRGTDRRTLVDIELVEDDDLAGPQAGDQQPAHIQAKGIAVGGALECQRRTHSLWRQRRKERDVGAVVARDTTARSLPGARAYRRVMAMVVPLSATKTRRAGSRAATAARHAARAASSRSLAISDVF